MLTVMSILLILYYQLLHFSKIKVKANGMNDDEGDKDDDNYDDDGEDDDDDDG